MARMVRVLLLAGAPLLAMGCACAGGAGDSGSDNGPCEEECSDLDLDGYGVGCSCLGPDCDDFNPEHWDDCGENCDEYLTGCPCDTSENQEPEVCYEGPEGTAGNGTCRGGLRMCEDGRWSPCEGQVFPRLEACDDFDNDCDGEVDNGVRNACGTCGGNCDEDILTEFDCETNGDGSLVCDGGSLTLDEASALRSYIWIPNRGGYYGSGSSATVSKVNTRTYEEEGRYRIAEGAATYVGGISTNIEFNCVVTASYPTPMVTRVDSHDCPAGDTSTGPDDVLDFGDDACMIWSTNVEIGGFGFGVTNLAWELRDVLDGRQYFIWVVNNGGRKIIELTEDGEVTDREVVVAPASPGAIAFDLDMELWVADAGSAAAVLTEVDTVEAEIIRTVPMPGWTCLCMSADPDNNIWVTGSGGPGYVLDQEEETAYSIGIPYGVGLAVNATDYGWFGGSNGKVYRADASDGIDSVTVEEFDVGLGSGYGYGAIYLGVDIDEQVWGVNQAVAGIANVWAPEDPDDYETAVDSLEYPGACGDMTGTQLAHMVEPAGVYNWLVEGCMDGGGVEFVEGGTVWAGLAYDGDTPGDSLIKFAVRTANTLTDLQNKEYIHVCTASTDPSPCSVGAALDAEGQVHGNYLDVKITLLSGSNGERPTLDEIRIGKGCDGLLK